MSKNKLALLEECALNGAKGKDALYAWFCNERGIIEQEIIVTSGKKHTDSFNKVADAMQVIETELKNGAFTSSEVHAINLFAGVVGRATGSILKAMIKSAEKN